MFDFKNAEQQYFYLTDNYNSGGISYEQLEIEISKLTGCDENGIYWAISMEGYWLMYDGTNWVQSEQLKRTEVHQETSPVQEQHIEVNESNTSMQQQSNSQQNSEDLTKVSFGKLLLGILKKLPGVFLKRLPKMLIMIGIGVVVHTYLTVFKNEGFNDNYTFISSLINVKGLGMNSILLWGATGYLLPVLSQKIKSKSLFSTISRMGSSAFRILPKIFKDKNSVAILFFTIGITFLIGKSIRPMTGIMMTGIGLGAISKLFAVREKTNQTNPTLSTIMKSGGSALYACVSIGFSDISKWLKNKGKKRINFNIEGFSKYTMAITGGMTIVTFIMSSRKIYFILNSINVIFAAIFIILGIVFLVMNKNTSSSSLKGIVLILFSYGMSKLISIKAFADDGGWEEAGGTLAGWIKSPGALPAVFAGTLPTLALAAGACLDAALKSLFEALIPQLEGDKWWDSIWDDNGGYINPEDRIPPEEQGKEEEEEIAEGYTMYTDVNPETVLADGTGSVWVYGKVVADQSENDGKAQAATEAITFSKNGGYSQALSTTGNTGMTGDYMAAEFIASTPMGVKETFGTSTVVAKAFVGKKVVSGTQEVSMEFIPSELYISFGCDCTEIVYGASESITLSAAVYSSNPDFNSEKLIEYNKSMTLQGEGNISVFDIEYMDEYACCEVAFYEQEGLEYLPEKVTVTAEVLIEGEVLTESYTFSVLAEPQLTLDKKEVNFIAGSSDDIIVTATLKNGGDISNWDFDFEIEYSEDIFSYDYVVESNKIKITITDTSDADDSRFEGNGRDYAKLTLHGYNSNFDVYGPIDILALKEGLYIKNYSGESYTSNTIPVMARENEPTKRLSAEVLIWNENTRSLVTDRSALDSIEFELGKEDTILHQNIFDVTNLRCELKEKDPSTSQATYEINIDRVFHMSKDSTQIPLIFTASSSKGEYERHLTINLKSSPKEYEEHALMIEVQKCHEIIDKLIEKDADLNNRSHSFVDEWSKRLSSNGLNYMRRHVILERAVRYNQEMAQGYLNEAYYWEIAENIAGGIDFVGSIAMNVVITVLSGPAGPAVLVIRTMGADILREQLVLAINCWQEGKSYDEWAELAWGLFSVIGMGSEITFEALQNAPNAKLKLIGYIGQILFAIYMVYDGSCDEYGNLSLKALATNLFKIFTTIALSTAAMKMTATKMTEVNGKRMQQKNIDQDGLLKDIKSGNGAKAKNAKDYIKNMFKDKELVDYDGKTQLKSSDAIEIMRDPQAVRTLKNIDEYPPEIKKMLEPHAKAFGERMRQFNNDVDTELLKRLKEKYPDQEFEVHDFRTPGSDPNKINTDRDVRILCKDSNGNMVEFETSKWKHDYNELYARNSGMNHTPNAHEVTGVSKERWDSMSQIEKEEIWNKSLRQEATDYKHEQACIDYSDQANKKTPSGKIVKVERPNVRDVIDGKARLKDPSGVGQMFENKVLGEYSDTPFGKSEAIKQAQKGIDELQEIMEGYKKGKHQVPDLNPEYLKMVDEIKDLPTDYRAGFDADAVKKYRNIDANKIKQYAECLKSQFGKLSSAYAPKFDIRGTL